jgi:hypothetical protein
LYELKWIEPIKYVMVLIQRRSVILEVERRVDALFGKNGIVEKAVD